MAAEAIVLFMILCHPTLLFLRWLLRPIWPSGKETGRTQFFICDYFVLVVEIAAAMRALSDPLRHTSGDLLILVAIIWIGITAIWILCCRALSLMRVTRSGPRIAGLILIPVTIAAAFGNTGALILFLFSSRLLNGTFYNCWVAGVVMICVLAPAISRWIAASTRPSPTPSHVA